MTEIYLIRHGQTVWNTETRMQGWLDSPLTTLGQAQAMALAEALARVRLDALYTSSSGRAVATAELIAGRQPGNLSVSLDGRLREIHLGPWEGLTKSAIKRDHPEQAWAFWKAPQLYRPDRGESFPAARARLVSALSAIAAVHTGARVAVVSHGVAIQLLLTHILGLPLERLWETPTVHQASLSLIEYGERARLVFADGREHLEGLICETPQVV